MNKSVYIEIPNGAFMKTHFYCTLVCLGMGTPSLAIIGRVLDTAGDIAKGTTNAAARVVDPSRRTNCACSESREYEALDEQEEA